ncbi:MAG TPA: UMP kinase [Candidatus Paceibacterota bacterium]|nr:UMP kinase [Candidatus Paceibacterota bacterium]
MTNEIRTVLIKLSGEALARDGEKYSTQVLESIASQISKLLEKNLKIALVCGGGNLFRGRDLVDSHLAISRATADYIGMLATLQNALVLRDDFESKGIPTRVLSAISVPQLCEPYIPNRGKRHMEKGRVVIFAAGLGVPFFTTDTTAVERSLEIGADLLVLAKHGVNGLYTADPKHDPSAEKIHQTSCTEILEKNFKVADGSAIALAKDNNLPMKIVAVEDIENILDENTGSYVEPH